MAVTMTPGQELKRLRQRAIRQLIAIAPDRQPARARRRAHGRGLRGHPGDGQPRHHRARAAQGAAHRRPRLCRARRTSRRPRPRPATARRRARRPLPSASDERLRRILADVPVTVGRSGLTLVLVGTPGTASVVAQAIDESSLQEQEGTLAGDNTLLVLFADEPRLERWLERFEALQRPDPGGPVTA